MQCRSPMWGLVSELNNGPAAVKLDLTAHISPAGAAPMELEGPAASAMPAPSTGALATPPDGRDAPALSSVAPQQEPAVRGATLPQAQGRPPPAAHSLQLQGAGAATASSGPVESMPGCAAASTQERDPGARGGSADAQLPGEPALSRIQSTAAAEADPEHVPPLVPGAQAVQPHGRQVN